VEVNSKGELIGDIRSKILVIEEGGVYKGTVEDEITEMTLGEQESDKADKVDEKIISETPEGEPEETQDNSKVENG
jgi:cytoskeletal protein CcmA (bactofilin family)